MIAIETILERISLSKSNAFTKKEILRIIKDILDEIKTEPIESCGVKLYPDCCKVEQGDKVNYLPNKAFKMLYFFMQNANAFLTRDDIINNCWERDVIVGQRTIDVHIFKIKSILVNKNLLVTKKRIGYGWISNTI
jgi:two-component system alkaline phosphatase synthesis response regulator PhoP